MLAVALAEYLDGLGLLEFDPFGVVGNAFIAAVPTMPDEVVVLSPTGGPQPDFRHGYDNPSLQLRYRSTRDPRPALETAQAIYAALQSMGDVTLPDGTYVVSCTALQSDPVYIGADQNGRHEYTQNYQFTVRSLTAHRE